jgi:glycosyltransferase involved in cell wall biosynthesis
VNEVRVLLVAHTFPPVHGGSAVVYGGLCEHLPAGFVHVLAARCSHVSHQEIPGVRAHDAAATYPITRMPLLRARMMPPSSGLLESLRRFAFIDIPLYVRILWTAGRLVRRHQVKVVCIGELVTGGWLGLALKKLFGVKLIFYIHGEEITTQTEGRLQGAQRQRYLAAADRVVSVSRFTTEALVSLMGVSPERIVLLQNGVDTRKFMPASPDGAWLGRMGLQGKRIVLTVGRLVPRKGADMAIRAMQRVVAQCPDVHHLIVGEGSMRTELEQLISELGMQNHVTLTGGLPFEDVLRCFQACELFLMPNRTLPDGDTEGFGLVFLEANACGKPVIGGRAGGAVDAIVDGVSGFLVDGHAVQDIADKVLQLLQDPSLREQMGHQAHAHAQAHSVSSVAERFELVCKSLQ